MWPFGNVILNCALRSASGVWPRPGGVRRPGGAPGLQNQCGAQQSPRWVRFPSASASSKTAGQRSVGVLEYWVFPSLHHSITPFAFTSWFAACRSARPAPSFTLCFILYTLSFPKPKWLMISSLQKPAFFRIFPLTTSH